LSAETSRFKVLHKIAHKQHKHRIISTFSGCPPPVTTLFVPKVVDVITFVKNSTVWDMLARNLYESEPAFNSLHIMSWKTSPSAEW
jgi:hypothetical protein